MVDGIAGYALILKSSYDDSLLTFIKMVREYLIEHRTAEIDEDYVFEAECLHYFIYDFAIASGPEKQLRNHIRDLFVTMLPYYGDRRQMAFVADRSDEYSIVLKENITKDRKMMRFGNVFARHIGLADDPMLIMNVAGHFSSLYPKLVGIVNDILAELA